MRLSNTANGVIAELYSLRTLRLIRSIWKVMLGGCQQRLLRFHLLPLTQAYFKFILGKQLQNTSVSSLVKISH